MKAHPVFARVWDRIVRLGGQEERRNREELIGGAQGRVLEIGAGTGLNFKMYGPPTSVFAIEPEPNMALRAGVRAREAGVPVRLSRASGERLPFRDGVFDTVVFCYVLCTIPDAALAAAEARRVLKPGGRALLYEHVRSPKRFGARLQDRLLPVWRFFGAGCHPNRDTVSMLESVGFEVEVRRFNLGPPSPVRPHIFGVGRPS
jgi:ubiquinone/menaquinone biosynthesis C-methylase UbiE